MLFDWTIWIDCLWRTWNDCPLIGVIDYRRKIVIDCQIVLCPYASSLCVEIVVLDSPIHLWICGDAVFHGLCEANEVLDSRPYHVSDLRIDDYAFDHCRYRVIVLS